MVLVKLFFVSFKCELYLDGHTYDCYPAFCTSNSDFNIVNGVCWFLHVKYLVYKLWNTLMHVRLPKPRCLNFSDTYLLRCLRYKEKIPFCKNVHNGITTEVKF